MEGSSMNYQEQINTPLFFKITHSIFKTCTMGTDFETPKSIVLCFAFSLFFCSFHFSFATNTIYQGQVIRDGESIISPDRKFELGFFSPDNSTNRYVGIWYHEVPEQTIVWVANRENPLSGDSGVITLNENGNLIISDENKSSIWSSNSSTTNNATMVLNNNGNLVISNNFTNKPLWESFNYPTDTFLPNMEVHAYLGDEENRNFSSWKEKNDPSLGRFFMGIDPRVSPQLVFWDGPKRRWRSGLWDGQVFIGMPYMSSQYLYGFKLVNEGNGEYYITYTTPNESDLVRFRMGWNGFGEQLRWNATRNKWNILVKQPQNDCEVYNLCGPFGICNDETGSPVCGCTKGFEPRDSDQWEMGNRTGGCVRKTELTCGKNESSVEIEGKDGFLKVERVKWPDFADVAVAGDEGDCQEECLKNCSCNAYVFVKSVGCIVWTKDLVDMHQFGNGGGDLYIRVASSELGAKKKSYLIVIIISAVVTILILASAILLWWFRKKVQVTSSGGQRNQVFANDAMRNRDYSTDISGNEITGAERQTGQELSVLSFSDMVAATDNFSEYNKLGKGGFGPVYKGSLLGEEIAVKRLSKKSGQGLEEFKNEVILIAKLQHRNLVRILGCCIEGHERMLVYEYMPNKSLDSFIFDSSKQSLLDWQNRFTIIEGIARGLVYLHRDSRLRIIHRDLKASNILLDDEMNPKISDFGMAKIFGKNVNEVSTSRVVGTIGYIAPEYAMEGLFSVKSDVYSFGVLLLEIVSGRRNNSFRSEACSNIIGYAWELWYTGKGMELVDPSILSSYNEKQILRCIHIAMLCVQDLAEHRPTMSSVVLMLESENVTLPIPREPTFTSMGRADDIEESKEGPEYVLSNNITISVIIGR